MADDDIVARLREYPSHDLMDEAARVIEMMREDIALYTDRTLCVEKVEAEKERQRRRADKAETHLAAAEARVKELEKDRQDGPCYYCGEQTSHSAGDLGLWPVILFHADDPSVGKWHHERCVNKRLHDNERAEAELRLAREVVVTARALDKIVAETNDHVKWFKPISDMHYKIAAYDALKERSDADGI